MKLTAVIATAVAALTVAPTETEAWGRIGNAVNWGYQNHLNAGGPDYQTMAQWGCALTACDEDDDDLGVSAKLGQRYVAPIMDKVDTSRPVGPNTVFFDRRHMHPNYDWRHPHKKLDWSNIDRDDLGNNPWGLPHGTFPSFRL